MKYVKRPVIIEAVQVTNEWFDGPHPNPLHPADSRLVYCPMTRQVEIKTLDSTAYADVGDWIITGVKGEVYPCKPDIFEATYRPAGESLLTEEEREALKWVDSIKATADPWAYIVILAACVRRLTGDEKP